MVVHGRLVHSAPIALAQDEQRAHVFVVTVGPLITTATRSGGGMVTGARIRLLSFLSPLGPRQRMVPPSVTMLDASP